MSDDPNVSDAKENRPYPPRKKGRRVVAGTVKTVTYALLIAVVIRTFLFQPYNIPRPRWKPPCWSAIISSSRNSPMAIAGTHSRSASRRSPAGSLPRTRRPATSSCSMPNQNSPDYMKDFIKRLIGMPGDHIQMINGVLYINDKPVPKVPVADYVEPDGFGEYAPCRTSSARRCPTASPT